MNGITSARLAWELRWWTGAQVRAPASADAQEACDDRGRAHVVSCSAASRRKRSNHGWPRPHFPDRPCGRVRVSPRRPSDRYPGHSVVRTRHRVKGSGSAPVDARGLARRRDARAIAEPTVHVLTLPREGSQLLAHSLGAPWPNTRTRVVATYNAQHHHSGLASTRPMTFTTVSRDRASQERLDARGRPRPAPRAIREQAADAAALSGPARPRRRPSDGRRRRGRG